MCVTTSFACTAGASNGGATVAAGVAASSWNLSRMRTGGTMAGSETVSRYGIIESTARKGLFCRVNNALSMVVIIMFIKSILKGSE